MDFYYPIQKTVAFPCCHAPTICKLPDGDLLISSYAGQREGSEDSVVLGARYNSQLNFWTEQEVWLNVAGKAVANPRLFQGPDEDEVWLLSGINYGRWCSGDTYLFVKRTKDKGRIWTDLELLVQVKGLLGKNKPLRDGDRWLIPVEFEDSWTPAFLLSEDGAKSWELVGNFNLSQGEHLIQPTVVKLSDGSLLAYMRSQEGYIFESKSYDRGREWTQPLPTSLPNNNSGIDMIRLSSGELVLAYNPTGLKAKPKKLSDKWPTQMPQGFERWGPRTPLRVSVSKDEGNSWNQHLDLEEGSAEYSYPAIIEGNRNRIHVVYTYERNAIKHWIIRRNDLLN